MKTTLLIMAAGIGSRFGGEIKQLRPVGLHDELIIDYSIHDAIVAGFDKIVIVLRRSIERDFQERIGSRLKEICERRQIELQYAFQELTDVPQGCEVPQARTKPWGTGHAVLAARETLRGPFLVINADDYYGRIAFRKMHDFLIGSHENDVYGMAGFVLKNTLSKNGSVTRGVCKVSGDHLVCIEETHNIVLTDQGIFANGKKLNPQETVSMNMWGFPAEEEQYSSYLARLQNDFQSFLQRETSENPLQAEFLIPEHIGKLLKEEKIHVQVMPTEDQWYGVTYKEDEPAVREGIRRLVQQGVYAEDLYSDL